MMIAPIFIEREIMERNLEKTDKKKWFLTIFVIILISCMVAFFIFQPFIMNVVANKFINNGNYYLKEEQYEEAINNYRKALKFDTSSLEAYSGLNEIFIRIQQYEQAEEILRDGIKNVDSNEDKAILFQSIQTIYRTLGKDEEDFQKLNDEAFSITGKREFGERYEKEIVKYLRNIALFSNTSAMVPAFESAEEIDKNWLLSAFSWKTEGTELNYDSSNYSSSLPSSSLEDVQINAQKYLNPQIILPKDYDYHPYIGDTMIRYEADTNFILSGAKGFMGYVNNDFIVTDFYKKENSYHIEGVFLGLYSDNILSKTGKINCGVFINEIGDGDISKSVGTATATSLYDYTERLEESISYSFNLKDMDTNVYHYVLEDNPEGNKSNAEDREGEGAFFLISRTEGKKLSEVSEMLESSRPGVETISDEALILKKYDSVLKEYQKVAAGEKGSSEIIQPDLQSYGVPNGTTLSYLLRDMNEDGSPELFIAATGHDNVQKSLIGNVDYNIYDMYTLNDNGSPVPLLGEENKGAMGVRGRYIICEDNAIFGEGSGGATYHSYSVYRLVEPTHTKAHIIEQVFIDSSNLKSEKYYLTENDHNPIPKSEYDSMISRMKEDYVPDRNLVWTDL